jgi:hypothetical protein
LQREILLLPDFASPASSHQGGIEQCAELTPNDSIQIPVSFCPQVREQNAAPTAGKNGEEISENHTENDAMHVLDQNACLLRHGIRERIIIGVCSGSNIP